MTLSLRPHHLLCMLTYLGKGYTPAFVANYDRIVARVNSGEDIVLTDGPDAICGPMLNESICHCHETRIQARDQAAARDISATLGQTVETGATLRLGARDVATLRNAFAKDNIRSACKDCQWDTLCSAIAKKNFRGCRLAPPA
ncbi:DUF1284 domain-containing protein [Rhodobacterales bacterium]|nr:DUF1284 domain-containing protein [Rhodobacterales bacterium]